VVATASVVTIVLAVLAVVRALLPDASRPVSAVGPFLAAPPSSVDTSTTAATAGPVAAGQPTRATGTPRPGTTAPSPTAASVTTTTNSPLAVSQAGLTAAYAVDQRWPGGFIARIAVTNGGSSAQGWQVIVQYPATVAGLVADWSNASVQPHTDATPHSATITSGTPVGGGQSVNVFVQFGAMGENIAPIVCTVNGAACSS
jgi:hypothetical protein